ncbi:MAG: signal peptidase I [Candidatus Pacearchaeota archaeon]
MKIGKLIFALTIFILGFIVSFFINIYLSSSTEHPLSYFTISEINSPSDFIKENQIEVYHDKIVIRIENASLSEYASTGSMLPVFDNGANGIRIVPKSENEVNVGDIITFERNNILIVHRVVEKGQDEQGIYFITKGDNNFYSDGKIRFSDIRYKTIGILY